MSLATRPRQLPPVAPHGAAEDPRAGGEEAVPSGARWRLSGWELVTHTLRVALFTTLASSMIYAIIHATSPPQASTETSARVRADYVLMTLQCTGGLIVMFLPTFSRRRWAITVPSVIQIPYFVFLYAAIYLGEVRSFYYRFPAWDSILHVLGGAMLAALGFLLAHLRDDDECGKVRRRPVRVAFFSFCFAVACGAVWEMYEFSLDGLFGTNMQKVTTATGQVLMGRDALTDTMTDLILGATAALIVSVVGYVRLCPSKTGARVVPDVLRTQ